MAARSGLGALRCVIIALFCASLVLPAILEGANVLWRLGDDDLAAPLEYDDDLGGLELHSRQQASLANAALPAGTPLVVLLLREVGTEVRVFVGNEGAGCRSRSLAGEADSVAAERVLLACARLRGPPDVEFLRRVDDAGDLAATFVALVRGERLRGAAALPDAHFVPWAEALVASSKDARAALAAAAPFVAPFLATAGRRAGICAPPAAVRPVV